jgi:hypothetical protein
VDAERPPVRDESRQRVDQRAEVDAFEGRGEAGVAVQEDDDPRQRLDVRQPPVLGQGERACLREQQLAPLERPAQQREEPLDTFLVLAAHDRAGVRQLGQGREPARGEVEPVEMQLAG